MKNNILEKIEKINEEKKLSEDSKKVILIKIFDNLIIGTAVISLFTILVLSALFLDKQTLVNIYNLSSIIMIAFAIFIFEVAYKKDSGSLAVYGIEMLVISIVILFMPYSLVKLNAFPLKIINVYVVIYYITKAIIMYSRYKSKTLLENSDIKQIVKKESKDSKVEEAIEEIKKNKQEDLNDKQNQDTKKVTKKRTTKKAANTKKATNKSKTATKETTKSKAEASKKEGSEEKKTENPKTVAAKKKTTTKKAATSKTGETKKSSAVKSTPKKTTTAKKKEEPKQETTAPKKRGRPRKETSTK